MATETIHVVDPDSGAGYDYASLNAWEAAQERDLPTADEQETAKCRSTSGSADTTAVAITDWITDATRYIKIWTDTEESYRHDGKWNTSKFRLDAGNVATALGILEKYVDVFGLQISINNVYARCIKIDLQASIAGGLNIAYNIIKAAPNGKEGICAYYIGTGCYVWNNIVYDFVGEGSYGIGIVSNIADVGYCRNNTVYGCSVGILSQYDNWYIENNICNGNGTDFNIDTSNTEDYNLSEDATASGAHSVTSAALTFKDEAGNDFHLAAGDAAAIDAGDSFSGDYTDDIDGDTRSGTWDIGADEYVAAGGGISIPVVMKHLREQRISQ